MSPLPFNPVYKPRQLLCGTGQTVVVTGWTVKTAVAKSLTPDQYAAIGQLYSPTRGINILLRNLLANPQIHYLVGLSVTREDQNAGAVQCLLDFFAHGFVAGETDTGQDCWLINSPIKGYIDLEIPPLALESLREHITVQAAGSIQDAVARVQELATKPTLPTWGQPQIFALHEPEATILPGPRYGHRIEGRTIAETWVKIIHRIKSTGVVRPTAYDGQWQELVDLVAVVTDEPEEFYFPEPNYLPISRTFIQEYQRSILEDSPHQAGLHYTYGQRLRSWFGKDQIQQAITKLRSDLDTSRVVMSLWDVDDYDLGDSPPCLNHIWVRVIEGELSLTATFRSNDMFSAWPANAMGLRALQQHICSEVQKGTSTPLFLGPLVTVSQSAHIYDDCWENAERVIASQYLRLCRDRRYDDPVGSFVITLGEGKILVEHMTPGSGETVGCFSGSSAATLYRQLAQTAPGLDVEHALYLGTELQKAEIALRQNWSYEQDQPLRQN